MIKKISFSILVLSFVLLVVLGTATFRNHGKVFAQSSGSFSVGIHPLHGYAWSTNFGWIQFDPTYGGVFASTTDNTPTTAVLTGYAWVNPEDSTAPSNNVGWLSFNDYGGCGSQPTINLTSGAVTGWARFYNAISESNNDGNWTGCVHLNGTTLDGYNYGGTITSGSAPSFTTGSYFWGGEATNSPNASSSVGWIHLCGSNYCVTIDAGTTTAATMPGVPGPLSQSNLNQCDNYGGIVGLTWSASNPAPNVSSGGGYYIYRTNAAGVTDPSVSPNPTVSYSNSASISGLTAGNSYYFRVSAFNVGGGQVAESAEDATFQGVASKVCNNASSGIIFNAVPSTVPRGGHCNLNWTVAFPSSCSITSTHDVKSFAPITIPTGTTPSNPSQGSTTTSPITQSANYTLTCVGSNTTLSAQATCSIAPSYNEF